jgi:hypothetical protein
MKSTSYIPAQHRVWCLFSSWVFLWLVKIHLLYLSVNAIWASLTVTIAHVGGQPALVRGGRGSDSALPFPSSLPIFLWCSPGKQIFCVQYSRQATTIIAIYHSATSVGVLNLRPYAARVHILCTVSAWMIKVAILYQKICLVSVVSI